VWITDNHLLSTFFRSSLVVSLVGLPCASCGFWYRVSKTNPFKTLRYRRVEKRRTMTHITYPFFWCLSCRHTISTGRETIAMALPLSSRPSFLRASTYPWTFASKFPSPSVTTSFEAALWSLFHSAWTGFSTRSTPAIVHTADDVLVAIHHRSGGLCGPQVGGTHSQRHQQRVRCGSAHGVWRPILL